MQDGAGDVFHAFHQFDQLIAIRSTAGREANAAIAHHRRGHAMPGGGRQMRIPHGLPIIMRVDINEAGCHQLAARVNFRGAAFRHLSNGGDAPAGHGHIRFTRRGPCAIHHNAATDHDIGHGQGSCFLRAMLSWIEAPASPRFKTSRR